MKRRNIIVIGASAGGVSALQKLFAQLPGDLDASIFVVLHISAESPSTLASLIDNAGPLKAATAVDQAPILPGQVYVAPPDFHLLVKPGLVHVFKGPRENRHRPAIDPLFRSAAIAYTSQVVSIVLTGLLDDGTSGMLAVKRCGGIAIAQSPADAEYADMPKSAILTGQVDYQLPLEKMGSVICELAQTSAPAFPNIPQDIAREAKIAESVVSDIHGENRLGHLVPVGCPECGGPLWAIEADGPRRYRCHVGHGFTAKALLSSQNNALEQALWVAMRTMEERANLTKMMARDERERGRDMAAQAYEERSEALRSHAQVIRRLLTDSP